MKYIWYQYVFSIHTWSIWAPFFMFHHRFPPKVHACSQRWDFEYIAFMGGTLFIRDTAGNADRVCQGPILRVLAVFPGWLLLVLLTSMKDFGRVCTAGAALSRGYVLLVLPVLLVFRLAILSVHAARDTLNTPTILKIVSSGIPGSISWNFWAVWCSGVVQRRISKSGAV